MIVICFDLSSTCIGATFAQLKNNKIVYLQTLAIIPTKPTGIDLGYTTKEPKKLSSRGHSFLGFLKPKETTISKEEAKRRISHYKNFVHRELLLNIGKQCGQYIEAIKPNAIAIEKNKSFNGILTTKLLAEIAGGLYFIAGAKNIPLYDYDEATIRSNIRQTIPTFQQYKVKKMALDTKWEIYCRLRSYFETNYPNKLNFTTMTMDESDSLAVFYHFLQKEILQ